MVPSSPTTETIAAPSKEACSSELAPAAALPSGDARQSFHAGAGSALDRPSRRRGRLPITTLVQSLGLALFSYLCLFHLSVVRGSSMAPSIHDGDRILIDSLSYVFGEVHRGDIVVLKYPLDPSLDYIKRVVGLPGDEIVIDQGQVWVNGELQDEPYVQGDDVFSSLRTHVRPAHYFVLGDNRSRSCDSREFGQVPQDYVRGKVELRLWPLTRAGRIDG